MGKNLEIRFNVFPHIKEDELDKEFCILAIINLLNLERLNNLILKIIYDLVRRDIYIMYILESNSSPLIHEIMHRGLHHNSALITIESAEIFFRRAGIIKLLEQIEREGKNPGEYEYRCIISNSIEKNIKMLLGQDLCYYIDH
jgi:hypothetical protein